MKIEANDSPISIRMIAPQLLLMAFFSLFINVLYLSSPLYLIQIYNRVLVGGNETTLILLSFILFLAVSVMFVLDFVRAKMLVRCSIAIDRKLSGRIFKSTAERSWSKGVSLGTRALRDFDEFRNFITGSGAYFAFDAPWAPLYLIILYMINPILGYIGTFGFVLLGCLAFLNEFITRVPMNKGQEETKRAFIVANNVMHNSDVVRAMGMLTPIEHHWQERRAQMLFSQAIASDRSAVMTAGVRSSRLLLQSMMLGVGAWLALEQVIMPATIFASSIIMSRALAPIERMVATWRQARSALASYKRIKSMLDAPSIEAPKRVGNSNNAVLEGKDVSYSAPTKTNPLFENISFKVGEGEVLGIAGPSGSGKSSLIKMVIGTRQPTNGSLQFGGLAIQDWDAAELGRMTGYLPQNTGLFNGTIRENIARFGTSSMDEIIEAAEMAGIHKAILDLPDQYETIIGMGGEKLSGGEMQQLALARALLCKPKLLVLDEPSLKLDEAGKLFLRNALISMKKNGSIIVLVTQMAELIEFSDKIITLHNEKSSVDHQLNALQNPPEKRIVALQ